MPSFALVTEGITDQVALEAILTGHYDDGDLEFNSLQPLRDATDLSRKGARGGWESVLEYCADQQKLIEALEFNDYLVIQIDTDCGPLKNFDVQLTIGGVDKSIEQLVKEVIAKITSILGTAFVNINGEKIFYAICVHSLECWLLPLHATSPVDISRTKTCAKHLAIACGKKGIDCFKNTECYRKLTDEYAKAEVLKRNRLKNKSLEIFLESLPTLDTERLTDRKPHN